MKDYHPDQTAARRGQRPQRCGATLGGSPRRIPPAPPSWTADRRAAATSLLLNASGRTDKVPAMRQHEQQDVIDTFSLLVDAAGNVRRVVSEDIEAKIGIPRKWYEAVSRAKRHPPGQPWHVSELAAQMSLPQSSMTRLLDQLEQAGIVRRVADPANRRATLIEITALGDQTVENGMEVFTSSAHDHLVGLLTNEQLGHLMDITRILRDANAPRQALPD